MDIVEVAYLGRPGILACRLHGMSPDRPRVRWRFERRFDLDTPGRVLQRLTVQWSPLTTEEPTRAEAHDAATP